MTDETKEERWNHLAACGPIGYDIPVDDCDAITWAANRLTEVEVKERLIKRQSVGRLYRIQRKTDGLFSCGGTTPIFTEQGISWDSTKRIMTHLAMFRKAHNRDVYKDCILITYDLVPSVDDSLNITEIFENYEAEEIAAKLSGNEYW